MLSMKTLFFALLAAPCCAYTGANSPYAAGNANFPSREGGFGAETEKGLPYINVKYQFNAAKSDPLRFLKQLSARLAKRRGAFASASFLGGDVQDAISKAQSAAQVRNPNVPKLPSTHNFSEVLMGMNRAAPPTRGGDRGTIDPNVELEGCCS